LLLCQTTLSQISFKVFRDEAQWPPDMTYSLWVYFDASSPFVLTVSSNRRLHFWHAMKLEYILRSIWCPWSNGWRYLRCLFSTFFLAQHSITIKRLTWRLELAWKNTKKVLNYRVSLSTNTSKMNLSIILVKSRHRSSFVFGLCRVQRNFRINNSKYKKSSLNTVYLFPLYFNKAHCLKPPITSHFAEF